MSKMDYPDQNATSWAPRKPKVQHFGAKINAAGHVSALCSATPRAINLVLASWTNRAEAVTCKKCRLLLDARNQPTKKE